MCGIMGYIGNAEAWGIVVGGLRRLEYRGYDSAGIVTVSRKRFRLARKVGHLRALEEATPEGLPGNIGIGHTRWATHGGVTEANCHPHLDSKERIALVHNGIIDNVEALRAELSSDGMQFRSETDTEVLAELIGRNVESGMQLRDAVVAAMRDEPQGFIFANLVDFDTKYGHRNDVEGYKANLERFDRRLPEILAARRDDDLLIVTADHGNDPTTPSTDHSREYVPVLADCAGRAPRASLGTRETFADLGQTVAEVFGVGPLPHGTSFLHQVCH